jgi:NADPH2 dehydrogenase
MSGARAMPKIRTLRTAAALRRHLDALGVQLLFDEDVAQGATAPLARTIQISGRQVGNRFAILPMEGWDATRDGLPTDLVRRRWQRFGASGAKLIWGGEAVAVRADGRANPNQLLSGEASTQALAELRESLVSQHRRSCGDSADLMIGLQLTHSGRWARPDGEPAPRTAYRQPLLDARVGVTDDSAMLSDDELVSLQQDFVLAARRAQQAGFDFVDIKHCHGYMLHEILSGVARPGRYGGDFAGRTRFLRELLPAVREAAPGLGIAVRLSIFDFVPFRAGSDGIGEPEPHDAESRPYAFGGDGSGQGVDLDEPSRFLSLLEGLGVELVCTTAGSPYTVPHIQRPAYFPPSDGYYPPEDPLIGVARQIAQTAELKRRHPNLIFVGTGYSYLQEWLPHVAQRVVGDGGADLIGIGRMVLSYPRLPADALTGRLDRKLICRTFSDCTTAPRNGMVSGCYPIDDFYKQRPERARLLEIKAAATKPRAPR